MKLRRSLAISAATIAASALALATAPAALAESSAPARPDASASASAAQVVSQRLQVSFQNKPAKLVAGTTAEFQLVVQNTTDHNQVFIPFLAVGASDRTVFAKNESIQYKDSDWHAATVLSSLKDQPGPLFVLGPVDGNGDPAEGAWTFVPKGETVTIPIRVTLSGDFTSGQGTVSTMISNFAVDEHGNDFDPPAEDVISSGGFYVDFVSGATTPSTGPSAPASSSAPASPSASASASKAPTATASASAGQGGTVPTTVATPTVKPSAGAAVAAKAKAVAEGRLAATGGGEDSTAIAGIGAAAVLLGAGTLVVLRRRKGGSHA